MGSNTQSPCYLDNYSASKIEQFSGVRPSNDSIWDTRDTSGLIAGGYLSYRIIETIPEQFSRSYFTGFCYLFSGENKWKLFFTDGELSGAILCSQN